MTTKDSWRGQDLVGDLVRSSISSTRQTPVGVVVYIHQLNPQDKFELVGLEEIRGTLISCNPSRAEVKANYGKKLVEFHSMEKGWQSFTVDNTKHMNWSPRTLVRKLSKEE